MASLNKGVVVAFGRFNPPTRGHQKLFDTMQIVASHRKFDAVVFPSQTQDLKDNPLPFVEKLDFLSAFFPNVVFSDHERIKTMVTALLACSTIGYRRMIVVSGSDQASEFRGLTKYVKSNGIRGQDLVFDSYEVIVVPGTRDPDVDDVRGVSASKMRAAARSGDFETFQHGCPVGRPGLDRLLFQSVRKYMGINESVESLASERRDLNTKIATLIVRYRAGEIALKPEIHTLGRKIAQLEREIERAPRNEARQRAFFLYGSASLRETVLQETNMRCVTGREALSVKLLESKLPFAVDVRGMSYVNIHHLAETLKQKGIPTTVYLHAGPQRIVSEDRIMQLTVEGLLRKSRYAVVDVSSPGMMLNHMMSLLEAEVAQAQVKTPTEVDRLRDQQKQELIMTKQRQAGDLLSARQRELAKKSRDDMNKIKTGEKPTSVTH